jgi:hypothetical protein
VRYVVIHLYIFRLYLEWWFGAMGVLDSLRYIPGGNGKLIILSSIILKVSLAAWNHGGASTASQSPVIVMESTAETATAPIICKLGGEHRSKHPVGRSKQILFC